MPAKRIDECRNKATKSRQTEDLSTYPISPEQCHAAKNTDDKEAKQKAAMQIGPQDHDARQQKASFFQTFFIEYHAKQDRSHVWRRGDVNIRIGRESGIKQTS